MSNSQSWKPWDYEKRVCEKKTRNGNVQFNKKDSLFSAQVMRKRTGKPIHHFKCSHCGWWHVGKKPALIKRNKKKGTKFDDTTQILDRARKN